MRRFKFSGYSVEIDERGERLTWRARWWRVLSVAVTRLLGIAVCGPWAYVLIVGPLFGEEVKPLDQATGLAWVAARGFDLFLLTFGLMIGLASWGLVWELVGFLARGTRTYALDRWDGRFRLGRRALCDLDGVEGVCLDVEDDSEGGRRWLIRFRLKGGQEQEIPHFYPGSAGTTDVDRFVNDIASFLKVPVVKGRSLVPGKMNPLPLDDEL
jgi:hypothetical protein